MRTLLTLVLITVLVVPLAGWWFVERPLPALDGLVRVPGLSSPVMVRFDSRQVPYIEAGSDADLYMAQGFVTARDRMFQMDMLRRVAEGRLSEVYGGGCLAADKLMCTIGCRRLGIAELSKLSEPARAMLEAYCRGVNQYLSVNGDKLPLEFTLLGYRPKPWMPADTMAIMKYLAYLQDESWQLDEMRQRILDKVGVDTFAQLFPEDSAAVLRTVPQSQTEHERPRTDEKRSKVEGRPKTSLDTDRCMRELSCLPAQTWQIQHQPAIAGSSAWVVAGSKTDSGAAQLACDKDELLSCPDLWYLCSLTGERLHVAGGTIPGIPGVLAGRNDYIAWGSSSLKADVEDLFLEEFSERFPTKYKTATEWQNAGEIIEDIPVRFGATVVHKVLITASGPVLIKNGTRAIVLAWTGSSTEKPAVESVLMLNHATDWKEFQDALKAQCGPAQMYVYADRAGNIGCHAAGDIPVRTGGTDGTTLSRGWETKGQWISRVPFEDLPSSYNPSSGYLIAANQKIPKGGVPLIGHQWCPPYRALRVESSLTAAFSHDQKLGLPDANELQSDFSSYLSQQVKREISSALSGTQEIDKYQTSALDVLKHWDGTLRPDYAAASIYESFLQTLARRLLVPKLGAELTGEYMDRWAMWPVFVERYLRERPPKWLPPEERTYSTFLLTTFSSAVNALRLSLRNDDPKQWPWQAVHRAVFKHIISSGAPWLGGAMSAGPIGGGGDADSVNALDVAGDTTAGQFHCRSGSTMRLLVDCADKTKFYQSLSLGQSGQLLSPSARDQLQAWLRVDPLPVAFSSEQLDHLTQHKLILTNTSLARLDK